MLNAGGLIKLHYHEHLDVLEKFTEVSDVLYFNGDSLFNNLELSQEPHNYLIKNNDGLFVDGSFIDRFDYHDNELYFDDIIVSREYTDQQITNLVNSLFDNNTFLPVGKIDLTYWFDLQFSSDTRKIYKNKSDMTMSVLIINNNLQTYTVSVDNVDPDTYSNSSNTITLLQSQLLDIQSINDEPLTLVISLQ